MGSEYILADSEGYPYNSEFKPDFVKNGDKYHGYKTNNQEALFYYFAVMGYDLVFTYNGATLYRRIVPLKGNTQAYSDGVSARGLRIIIEDSKACFCKELNCRVSCVNKNFVF